MQKMSDQGKNMLKKKKMDPIFEHPVFDSAREKMKRFIRHIEKSQKSFENSL